MNPLFLVSGLGMMALVLGVVAYWRQRNKVVFVLFLWGALAWVVGIILKSIAAIPVPAVIDTVRRDHSISGS